MEIIKYAAVAESQTRPALLVKVSAQSGGEPIPLTTDQENGLKDYLHQVKDAGVLINVINYQPDKLQITIRVYYDPSIIDSTGTDITEGNKPVEIALDTFLQNLPYNGELILQSLQDALQLVPGVLVVNIDSALTAWIDPLLGRYGSFTSIDVRKVAVSGYFKIDSLSISYIPNV